MILLDTNVISEPLRPRPDSRVVAWLAAQDDVALSAVSVAELLAGVRMLPHGRRRSGLMERVEAALDSLAGRVLPYDDQAARAHAELRARGRDAGRSLSVEDGMIAGIARVHRCALATRNVRDFDDLGITVLDPWAI